MFERIKLAVTPLAHSRIRVKQIIEKPMESRKNYVLRCAENVTAMMMQIALGTEISRSKLECRQQENRFSEVPVF
jgi:hypothetical protein